MSTYEESKEQGQVVDSEFDGAYLVSPRTIDLINEDDQEPVSEEAEVEGEAPSLDVDLSMLDLPEEKPAEEEKPVDQLPGFEQFSSDFKKFTGLDLPEAVAAMRELQTFRQQQVVAQQEAVLKNAWGVDGNDFTDRLTQVRERFQKYSPELKQKLDNPEGAQLIWAKIEQERAAGKKQVPTLDKSSVRTPASSQPKYKFTRAQIARMSESEYAQNAAAISVAYREGLVK